jgi:hypothetical protein
MLGPLAPFGFDRNQGDWGISSRAASSIAFNLSRDWREDVDGVWPCCISADPASSRVGTAKKWPTHVSGKPRTIVQHDEHNEFVNASLAGMMRKSDGSGWVLKISSTTGKSVSQNADSRRW